MQMFSEKIKQFSITQYLDEICENLRNSPSRFLILTAETAAGKSTVLPLALLEKFTGKIIMTEPRRLAVLGVASRVSELWNEVNDDKKTVGYKIHLENTVTEKTRLEVVTEAILVRQLQKDPALEGYNVVVLDEFHERSINTDLALAFLKEAMALRDDLYVIITSATIDTEKLTNYLSRDLNQTENLENENKVPVMKIPGRQFPVEKIYDAKSSVCDAVLKEAEKEIQNKEKGNILVFLPGISDIKKAYDELDYRINEKFDEKVKENLKLCVLHSSISLEEQKKIISDKSENQTKKIILSSAIAETSLTVPGVICVIDSGLARVNRMNVSTGMENLTTETESEFSAEQRAGRAGRLGPGKCIRLWSVADARIKEMPCEILRADLCNLVLECCERGIYKSDGIDWLEKPTDASWNESIKLLQSLKMIKQDFRITEKGKTALKLGIHPRLAGIAIDGFDYKNGEFGKKVEEILIKYGNFGKSSVEIQRKFINDLKRRLKSCNESFLQMSQNSENKTGFNTKLVILSGYADRLAKRVSEIGKIPAEYKFAGGRKAILKEGKSPEWIVAPEVLAGQREGIIFDYEELEFTEIENFIEENAEIREKCTFEDGKLQKFEEKCFEEIVLSSKKISVCDEDYAFAWVNEIKEKGLECLPFDEKIKKFLLRVEFFNQQSGKKLENKVDEKSEITQKIINCAEEWLVPFMGSVKKLDSKIVFDALYWFFNGSEIDEKVPENYVLPNGRKCKIVYEKQSSPEDKNQLVIRPVIEIIIQRIFGCFTTPEILGMKVLFKLLSPASRPLQITEDLENFWTGAWVEICKEMKGRYPKHNWDYRIVQEN